MNEGNAALLRAIGEHMQASGVDEATDFVRFRTVYDAMMPSVYAAMGGRKLAGVVETDAPVPSGAQWSARLYSVGLARAPRPAILYFHGGGFVMGTPASAEQVTRRLALDLGALVVSIRYRLAPEHPAPAAFEDGRQSLSWLIDEAEALGIDPSRIAIAGDSAGATLAAMTALAAPRERPPCALVLAYPAADATLDRPSVDMFGDGRFGIAARELRMFFDMFLAKGADLRDPGHSPIASDRLHALPPVQLIVAGKDPLRDDGRALAGAIAEAGVDVETVEVAGAIHGFLMFPGVLADADRALGRITSFLRDRLGAGPAASNGGVLKLVRFRARSGTDPDQLLRQAVGLADLLAAQPGFLGRDFCRVGEEWLDVVRWSSEEIAHEAEKALGQMPAVRDFVALIEPASFSVHYAAPAA